MFKVQCSKFKAKQACACVRLISRIDRSAEGLQRSGDEVLVALGAREHIAGLERHLLCQELARGEVLQLRAVDVDFAALIFTIQRYVIPHTYAKRYGELYC